VVWGGKNNDPRPESFTRVRKSRKFGREMRSKAEVQVRRGRARRGIDVNEKIGGGVAVTLDPGIEKPRGTAKKRAREKKEVELCLIKG